MQLFIVTIGRKGAGSGTLQVPIAASTPDEARKIVAQQYPGYIAQNVKST